LKALERWARVALYTARLVGGFAVYLFTRRTPQWSYYGMVALFCMTQGRSNDLLSRLIGIVQRPYRLSRATGVLGDMAEAKQRDPVVAQLQARGYYVFPTRLPDDLCRRLLEFGLSQPCKARRMDDGRQVQPGKAIFPRDAPQAVRYEFETQDLLDNPDVQALLADLSLVALAQGYLGARPAVDVLNMWWQTDFSKIPDSEAAQFFHFDMDRPKWLKFFIYLTNVESQNGPHSFVAGSHRTGAIPQRLLRKGYARLTDDEVAVEFDRTDIREFSAPRGTIIAEDTRGLHKGKHVQAGDRLVLQIQFSNSLFGASSPKVTLGPELCTDLRDRIARFPALYAAYTSHSLHG
jgi:hypothetical protein